LYVQDRSEPIMLPGALEIIGPLPVIASVKLSLPAGPAIGLHPDELPAGSTLNALMDVKNIERTSVLRLRCADGVGENVSLHIGGQTAQWSLQQLSPDQLFLAFDSSALPAGCSLQAVIDKAREGSSQPFTLAHIVRIPKIDSFAVSPDQPRNGVRQYGLTGENLEMIQKIGWTESEPVDVTVLPMPLPGPGLRQSMAVSLPDPPKADATLWIWLRGDRQGRAASIQAPVLPVAAAPLEPAAWVSVTGSPGGTGITEQQKKREQ
jgi:hypothetical protein